jgi:hypothetical protein
MRIKNIRNKKDGTKRVQRRKLRSLQEFTSKEREGNKVTKRIKKYGKKTMK